MINPTNLKFWFGVVEGVDDPLQNGRYQVRVYGHNTFDKSILPTEDLTWFPILSQGASYHGVGISPTFYQIGSTVLGAYLDEDNQNGVIFGAFHAFNQNDVSEYVQNYSTDGSNCVKEQATEPEEVGEQPSKEEQKEEKTKNGNSFADYIGYGEARMYPNQYNACNFYNRRRLSNPRDKSFVNMTIGQIKKIQRDLNDVNGVGYWAVGRYQLIPPTMRALCKRHGVSDNALYNKALQDKFCVWLLMDRSDVLKYIRTGHGFDSAALNIAMIWASVPLLKNHKGKRAGQSYYSNGVDKAHHSVQTTKQIISALHPLYKEAREKGMSDFDALFYAVHNKGTPVSIATSENNDLNDNVESMAENCGVDGVAFERQATDTRYPYNQAIVTPAGHRFELDNTPENERINIYHKSGTYITIMPNGDVLNKTVGSEYTFIKGRKNEIVTESSNIKVLGNCNLDIDGTWNVKAAQANFDIPIIKQAGEYYCNEQYVLGTKWTTHIHNGVVSGIDLSSIPVIAGIPVNSMSVEEATFQEARMTQSQINEAVANGTMSKEDAEAYMKEPSSKDGKEQDLSESGNVTAKNSACGKMPTDSKGNLNLNASVGKYLKLRQCVTGRHSFRSQHGLSVNEIYCNIKHVVENCYDTIKALYPDAVISSGFRNGSGRSQHERGQALDIVFPSRPKSQYYNIAKTLKDKIPFDQFLLEYRGTSSAWIHVSLKKTGGNRKQILTLVNDRTYSKGLVNYFGGKK